jgi:hypothetical protein
MNNQSSNPIIMTHLNTYISTIIYVFYPLTKVCNSWPFEFHNLIVLSLDPVITNWPGNASFVPLFYCCISLICVLYDIIVMITSSPINSCINGYELIGAKMAHSNTCSCPLNSIFDSPDWMSQSLAVYNYLLSYAL